MPHTVVLVGSLDTKGEENRFVRSVLAANAVEVIVVDTSVLGEPAFAADVSRDEVARAAGWEHADLVAEHDRGHALSVMSAGVTETLARLLAEGRIDGAMALGGTGGTSVAADAFRTLPVGFPKLIVSTAASGDTSMYVGETDLILVPSIVDIAGVNRISIGILRNAALAVAGMVTGRVETGEEPEHKPLVAASMFGVTTPCITTARAALERLGYEVIVFHMTGSGGRALESLIAQGYFAGVLDATTTELADHLVGGVFDAGADRLTAAGRAGIPQVISVGALDMVNFGPMETVPEQFRERNLYVHNSSVTLMRTTASECASLGATLAEKAVAATGPTAVFLPLRGVSAIAVAGGPFEDADADTALLDAVRAGLDGSSVDLVELDTDINDPEYAEAMVARLHAMITATAPQSADAPQSAAAAQAIEKETT